MIVWKKCTESQEELPEPMPGLSEDFDKAKEEQRPIKQN